ncbi:unnamed protein product, partial [Mesorhabditis belari]|uniref:Uncharacterized protein n=1 Tax=Mesorhabditis belari TaxID=2138241 RepID=A0AAF3ENI0_9BILA
MAQSLPMAKKQDKNKAFQKRKLKVGKVLRKTATTDTTFTAKKLTLLTQLGGSQQQNHGGIRYGIGGDDQEEEVGRIESFRGNTLEVLCKQLGHDNKTMRRSAIIQCKQLFTAKPDELRTNLHKVIPGVAKLIVDPQCDQAIRPQLRSLIEDICSVSESTMSAHFRLLLAYVQRGLSYVELSVRTFSLSILKLLMQTYKNLCRNDEELFQSFINVLGSPRKPAWNTKGFLECVALFLTVFTIEEKRTNFGVSVMIDTTKETISIPVNLTPSGNPFILALSNRTSQQASPFENPEAILQFSTVIAPIVFMALSDEKGGQFLEQTLAIIENVGIILGKQDNRFLLPNFQARLTSIWENVVKALEKKRRSGINYRQTQWLVEHGLMKAAKKRAR